MDTKFKIVIPVYNAEKWIDRCMMSVVNQTYKNFECIIIDDASLDGTNHKISIGMLSLPKQVKDRFKLVKRQNNCGALENIVMGINKIDCQPDDVIVLLDGDDWLHNISVLSYLNDVYQDEKMLLTYGNYINNSLHNFGVNRKLPCDTKDYRTQATWCTSHLRTFKYKLWNHLDQKDLIGADGKFYKMSWDLAIMIPMIEMAGNKRIKFIEKTLYVYNDENNLNDHKKDLNMQIRQANEIRSKPAYKFLKDI